MAWPLTKLTTYQIGTVISPDDLNSIQDGVNRIILGTYSVKGLTVDATGGVISAPTAGTISATGSILGLNVKTTTNAGSTPTKGTVYADNICMAWGAIDQAGAATIGTSYGIASVAAVLTGITDVTLNITQTSTNGYSPVAVLKNNGSPRFIGVTQQSATVFRVEIWNSAGTPTNDQFFFACFGRPA
jgi:hypothetical protein